MMDEGENSGGPSKSRTVLGDLTNRIGKRGPFGREKNEIKSSDFSDKELVKRNRVSPCTEINSLKGNAISGLSKVPDENRNPNVSVFGSNFPVSKNRIDFDNDCDGGYSLKGNNILMGNNSKVHEGNNGDKILDFKGEDVVSQSVNQLDVDKLDASKENMFSGNVEVVNEDKFPSLENFVKKSAVDAKIIGCGEFMPGSSKYYIEKNDPKMFDLGSLPAGSSRTVSESGNDCLDDGKNCEAGEVNISMEGTQSDIRDKHDDMDDHNADNFVLSQSGSIDCTVESESLKEDECAYMSGNACSCSFCTKAAYIWLDLNYQDIKARLSVMKKSQKDASILAERSSRIKFTEKSGTESFTRASKLESHLIYQWRSLFQRTADIWETEGNQLEASLLPLTELREKCKTDLELINAKRTENC